MEKIRPKLPQGFYLRDALSSDIDSIIKIVNSKNNRLSFGWIRKDVLKNAIDKRSLQGDISQEHLRVVVQKATKFTGEKVIAFVRLYHRLDGATTLHEIGVAEDCQNMGIGTYLIYKSITACRKMKMRKLCLKTPVGMRSNSFYPQHGFEHTGFIKGRVRRLNVYQLNLK